ncbi:hypothetical protein E5Q_06434 [Mixia osmundae IAM 14324]|uniref:SEC7 domain-containing protein n=1 Tax=Mixia osmundae (strain CBS 9802 / IAM 14324 / JCM 22182 / KY 12970) TaxID=764103 RepID=G7EA71_MIXOS|nr:hypothetical protein E5Q_06434 [Mixia osmundae IAM 14324]
MAESVSSDSGTEIMTTPTAHSPALSSDDEGQSHTHHGLQLDHSPEQPEERGVSRPASPNEPNGNVAQAAPLSDSASEGLPPLPSKQDVQVETTAPFEAVELSDRAQTATQEREAASANNEQENTLPSSSSVSIAPSKASSSSSAAASSQPAGTAASMSTQPTEIEDEAPSTYRPRSSTSATRTTQTSSAPPLLSGRLIIQSLESMLASKDAKRSALLREAIERALQVLKSPNAAETSIDPRVIFEPLRLACDTKSHALMIQALDSIGKLVSHSFFSSPVHAPSQAGTPDGTHSRRSSLGSIEQPYIADPQLAEDVVSTICNCFVDSTSSGSALPVPSTGPLATASASTGPDAVNLHLLSTLLSLILSSSLPVHQSSLLRAVRTVYNIFLLSKGHQNQTVAQGALGQIVGAVFGRVALGQPITHRDSRGTPTSSARQSTTHLPPEIAAQNTNGHENGNSEARASSDTIRNDDLPASEDAPTVSNGGTSLPTHTAISAEDGAAATTVMDSIQSMEARQSFEGVSERETGPFLSTNDLYIKDAFLVFRSLCKLSMKPLGSESERDIKSHAMRSKLLSLHLILTILHNHMALFVDSSVTIYSASNRESTQFIHAIKQYLCLSLSRNAISPMLNVFEISCEIFWRVLSGMRTKLKKEIEVLLTEIFLPILEMRSSSVRQKSLLLGVMARLCHDPQALVEIYINYDCDRTSLDNIYERLTNIVSRLCTTHYTTVTISSTTSSTFDSLLTPGAPGIANTFASAANSVPAVPTMIASQDGSLPSNIPVETQLKRQSLEALIAILRSLVSWAGKGTLASSQTDSVLAAEQRSLASEDMREADESLAIPNGGRSAISGTSTPEPNDDPGRFENAKARKTTLLQGIQKFNFKPKRGIEFLIKEGFVRSRDPKDVAAFLLHADGLSKAMIGEWLGEGDADNIATMHAFVDLMDFSGMRFTDALRMFLQSFRLPGEAQKIDRFMLKFAARYLAGNPSSAFANADTAYVLAYSTIMLNTDAHNPQVKNRMTLQDFYKNNRGINDGADLPEELLAGIYEEIQINEIRMKDEIDLAPTVPTGSTLAVALASVGRDLQREAYVLQSEGMASKTEALFKTMMRSQRRGATRTSEQFFEASNFQHVRPMFAVAWMPILAGISAPMQDSDDLELVSLSLEGFRQAIKIVCLFDLELERNAFVTTLAKFTFLNNLGEMRPKNVEAIKALLDVASIDGNYLKQSWREVIICISQLERFSLIAQGIDSRSLPEMGRPARPAPGRRKSTLTSKLSRPTDEVANETRNSHITISADRIFSSSSTLSGSAIVDFVRALSEISWEEIQSSGLSEHPRVFCLQKLVEISYYNMGRIRLEWSNIWAVLGEHFNQVCCHTNARVSFLALDSLRQLAMRFLEKEELAHFKFQKDFLKPFQYTMVNNKNPDARDMILQCLRQMLQARIINLRSGWRTMFGVFSASSKVGNERIATQAFEIVKSIKRDHFATVISHGSFADLAVCITDFCKISKYQRVSLHAIEMLKDMVPQMLSSPECPLSEAYKSNSSEEVELSQDPMLWWFPILFGFYDIIMNGEDMEVRKRALDYLFETLKVHGHAFPTDFWDSVCKEVLFPIFAILRSRQDVSRFTTQEDMSVWLSTTMIQALRNLVDLFTFYFDSLARMLGRLLDLLCECICQENDTLARIGTACLQQLVEQNVRKLTPDIWERIISTFITLFTKTTASQLFEEGLRTPASPSVTRETSSTDLIADQPPKTSAYTPGSALDDDPPTKGRSLFADRKRIFRQIIVKCVLQLLLIETAHEMLQNDEVYSTIPAKDLLRLMSVLDSSYRFAKKFNADKDLRMALWKVGFMKQLPNLLKQESSSAATLVNVLLRVYSDERIDHKARRAETLEVFMPLATDILGSFVAYDGETQARNITAWTPVVVEILHGFCILEDKTLIANVTTIYPLAVNGLARDVSPEIRESLRALFYRVGIASEFYEQVD